MAKEGLILNSNVKPEPKEELIESMLTKGMPLKLDDTEQKALVKEMMAEFDAIKLERKDIDGCDFDDFMDSMDRQRKGIMPKTASRAYNLDTGVSKIKCGDIVRTTISAICDVDPKISVNPRPGYGQQAGRDICQQQEEFIDYAVDERIPLRPALRLAAQSAVYKKVGMIKWVHRVRKEKRIGHDKYEGNPVFEVDERGNERMVSNKGLEDFLLSYGETIQKDKEKNPKSTKYDWIIKKLMEGKKAEFDYEYDDVVYNDPFPIYVDNRDFYVRKGVEGYIGLCSTPLIVERVSYTYNELKEFEKEYDFVNVDKLIYNSDKDENDKTKREGYATEIFNILECTYYANLPGEDELTKIICWIAEDKLCYLGGIEYPYTVIDCCYSPHYVKKTDSGFYQEGVAEDLTDVHLSRNAILNHTLEAAHMATTISPIAPKDSEISTQFIENTWANGMPLYGNPKEIDFLQNKIRPPDIAGLLLLDQTLSRVAGELSLVSDLRSGRESPLDPDAPGNKTIALLAESGKGVKDYVDEFSQGFNIDAELILKIYYEMGQDEQEYMEKRYRDVTGAETKKISKAAMIAKTRIQSQAKAYDFDKLNAKREDLAINAYLKNEGIVVNNPGANWERVRLTVSSWGPKWKNAIDKLVPPQKEFQLQQMQIAVQAIQQYVQAKVQEAQQTQQPIKMVPEELVAMMAQMQAIVTKPVDQAQEEQKQIEKQNK